MIHHTMWMMGDRGGGSLLSINKQQLDHLLEFFLPPRRLPSAFTLSITVQPPPTLISLFLCDWHPLYARNTLKTSRKHSPPPSTLNPRPILLPSLPPISLSLLPTSPPLYVLERSRLKADVLVSCSAHPVPEVSYIDL